ncbi:MAG TPA: hypothetical protein VGR71_00540 [Nitrospira sp.]|nr:hypothetical protein [Nitrospira sp.]
MTAAVEDPDVAVEMVKSTEIDCGVLVAPVAETVMVVEYVPAASPVYGGGKRGRGGT